LESEAAHGDKPVSALGASIQAELVNLMMDLITRAAPAPRRDAGSRFPRCAKSTPATCAKIKSALARSAPAR
jgi:hypothetical protein